MEGFAHTFSIGYTQTLTHVEDDNKWTEIENKIFQKAVAELDLSSPTLYEEMKARLPYKHIDQIKRHLETIIANASMFEAEKSTIHGNKDAELRPSFGEDSSHQKEKGLRWTENEHKAFLLGLEEYGKGNWSNISKVFVPSKTTSQVASHGQKYFRRLQVTTPTQKRRCSIHDTRIKDSTIVQVSPRLIDQIEQNPPYIPYQVNHNFETNLYGSLPTNDSSMSYLVNPLPFIESNYYPLINSMSNPMSTEVQAPSYTSSLVNPYPYTYDNSNISYTLPLLPSMYTNNEPYPINPITPTKNFVCLENDQESVDISNFLNKFPSSENNEATLYPTSTLNP